MRRHANSWAVIGYSLEMQNIPVAQGVGMPEGDGDVPINGVRVRAQPAGS